VIPLKDENPSRLTPYVNYTIIVLCVLVFLWQLSLGPVRGQQAVYAFGAIPGVLFGKVQLPSDIAVIAPWMSVLTSMFMHGGWMHLLGNMLYLWIFGDNIEDSMGHVRYFIFYVLCGLAAVLAQALPNTASQVPMIGASGAISGVLGAYLLLYPRARIHVIIPLGFYFQQARLPAMWVLLFWFALQLLSNIFQGKAGSGVAFGAHIGGFVAGLALIPLFKYRSVRLLNP
jgi:membrane associated rhomboid family serine protease